MAVGVEVPLRRDSHHEEGESEKDGRKDDKIVILFSFPALPPISIWYYYIYLPSVTALSWPVLIRHQHKFVDIVLCRGRPSRSVRVLYSNELPFERAEQY